MAERAKHDDSKDQSKFSKGRDEVKKGKATGTVKDTAKTREAKRSKGGGRERSG